MATLSIERELANMPIRPGVYKFFDRNEKLLYVGKANNLRSRVRSYFGVTHDDRPHIIPMIDQIEHIEITQTENEIEALVLESTLIKQYKPKYNVMLKDDKSYAWIYINTRDELPTVTILRSIDRKKYKKGRLFGPYPNSRATRQIFRYIRKLHPFCTCNNPKEPCLYYRMGLCINPHLGGSTVEEYHKNIQGVIKFLEGSKRNHIKELKLEMEEYSENQEYEKAATLRDKIYDLEHLGEDTPFYENESDYMIQKEAINKRALSLYMKDFDIPTPNRIECYDISNLQGSEAYGSMTVAVNGELRPDQYRVFKIKKSSDPDDYKMLEEVLSRRVRHIGQLDDNSLGSKPDLILIDGAKGQMNAVKGSIPEGVSLMGISKGRHLRKQGKRMKDMFWILREQTIEQVSTKEPRLLIALRDEAHRFAIKHHRIARSKNMKGSLLDKVEGVGPKIKKKLIKEYGSINAIKGKSVDEINSVIRNRTTALKIHEAVNPTK